MSNIFNLNPTANPNYGFGPIEILTHSQPLTLALNLFINSNSSPNTVLQITRIAGFRAGSRGHHQPAGETSRINKNHVSWVSRARLKVSGWPGLVWSIVWLNNWWPLIFIRPAFSTKIGLLQIRDYNHSPLVLETGEILCQNVMTNE